MADTLLLTSDLHGSLTALSMLIQRAHEYEANTILLAGDFCPSGNLDFQILLQSAPPLLLVRGNCDTPYDFSNAGIALPPLTRKIDWYGRTILMTHGHRLSSPYGQNMKAGDIFLSGHTHVPKLQSNDAGVILVNPGSPTYPRSTLGPTFALLQEKGIQIHRLEDDRPIAGLLYSFLPKVDQ